MAIGTDPDRATRRLVSATTYADFGVPETAGRYERVEAAIEHATRMAQQGMAPWEASRWCADALDVERDDQTIHAAVVEEVGDDGE